MLDDQFKGPVLHHQFLMVALDLMGGSSFDQASHPGEKLKKLSHDGNVEFLCKRFKIAHIKVTLFSGPGIVSFGSKLVFGEIFEFSTFNILETKRLTIRLSFYSYRFLHHF
jgi:hypothetical protein